MPIRLDELIVAIQNEIHENFQHYKAFFSSEVNQQEIETKVFQYVTERHFNTDVVDICIGVAANALCINLYIFEMYNNGRVATIHYNSFRQISHTDVYLVYETIAGRKKNEKIGHYQAIVKGPPCPTNITTPGQNQHVPQANDKPPLSTETCNQNPDNQHDEYDDDEDIFPNLNIPPMQRRPKDVADICNKQTSEEKELWTLSPMKTNHVGTAFEKSFHHSRKPKQKRLYLNMLQFEGVEVEEVHYVPIDVNGIHIYTINYLENEWIEHQKDHQWWNMHTLSRKGL